MSDNHGGSKTKKDLLTPAGPGRIGTVVDKYSIVRELGQGGMGAVYEARHATLARRFAIKFLLPGPASNAEAVRRFENEAKAAGRLEHPNLVAVTDFGRDERGVPYLVMEYLAGEDCSKLLGRLGPLPPERAANIVLQACRGLAVAHRENIIHRDIKPANLFLTDAGDGSDLVKVLDFGIAKLKNADKTSNATGTGQTFGTAHYMSPEQARGAADVDVRTDVWSLGVVLYELLAGRRPFDDGTFLDVVYKILQAKVPPISSLRPGLSRELVDVVQKAMASNPGERYQAVSDVGEALAPFAAAGRSAGMVQRSQGLAATKATPPTGLRPLGASQTDSMRTPPPAAMPPPSMVPGTPGTQTKRGTGALVVVGLIAVAGAVVVGAAPMKRLPSLPPEERVKIEQAPPRPAAIPAVVGTAVGTRAPPVAAPAVAIPAADRRADAEPVAPVQVDEPIAREVPPPSARAAAGVVPRPNREIQPPPGRRKSVRTVSERSEHRPHGPANVAALASPPPTIPSPPAPSPLEKPASSQVSPPSPASPAARHRVRIDVVSPY